MIGGASPLPPQRFDAVEPDREPDAGNGSFRAQQRQQPVVATAADERPCRVAGEDFEDQSRIVVERTAEGGVVGNGCRSKPVATHRLGARRKPLQRRAQRNAGAGGETFVTLPLSRQQMADVLGLTIETVSRQLSRLRSAGLIDTPSRREIVLRDRRELEELAG